MGFGKLLAVAALTCAAVPATAEVLGFGGQCVPTARTMSGVQLHGDAWTWWDQAAGVYKRGARAKVGAVLVFRPSGRMKLGHVAVISKLISPTIAMVTHSNWSSFHGEREQIERDVTLVDVSKKHDWSKVRVWYNSVGGLGGGVYPTYGFIYGTPDKAAGSTMRIAKPSRRLTGPSPDIVGAVIDSLS
ncbi:MAG: CHAP domain-containing protein [Sphingomonadaceae bacterium]|nr:CHAP domain-containing protein [Sphingomonadaceae bacterium]